MSCLLIKEGWAVIGLTSPFLASAFLLHPPWSLNKSGVVLASVLKGDVSPELVIQNPSVVNEEKQAGALLPT